jgi:hypothetical protein
MEENMGAIITIIFWIIIIYIGLKKNGLLDGNNELEIIGKRYGLTQTEINKIRNMTQEERKKYLAQYNINMANGINRPGTPNYVNNYQGISENYSKKVDCMHTTDKHEAIVSNYKSIVECIHKNNNDPIENKITNKDTFSDEDDDDAIKYL